MNRELLIFAKYAGFAKRIATAAIIAAVTLSVQACNDNTEDTTETVEVNQDKLDSLEQLALDSWMATNESYSAMTKHSQGYYTSTVTSTRTETADEVYTNSTLPIWIRYNILSTNLEYNVCNTRDEDTAVQQGTFNYYTRYAPAIRHVQDTDESINYLDLLFKNSDLSLKVGDKVTVVAPSKLIFEANGSGGYAGQYYMASNIPVISTIEITEILTDMDEAQTEIIDSFLKNNDFGTWSQPYDSATENVEDIYTENLYYTSEYTPGTDALKFDNLYKTTRVDYATINTEVDKILAGLFDNGKFNTATDEDNIIGTNRYVYVWYIARLADGFIVDTNIEEIRQLVFKDYSTTNTSALYYEADVDVDNYIYSWYHTIPILKQGSSTIMITDSNYAYGTNGSSASTEIQTYAPMIFQLFIEPSGYDPDAEDDEENDDE